MIFPTTVNGIPCQCRVLSYQPYLPMRITGTGFGDATPPEDEYFEFELLDRKGYRAKWLDRYIDRAMENQLLLEYLRTRQNQCLVQPVLDELEDVPY